MDALARFRDRYEPALLAYFLRRTGSEKLAWDLAAETFAAAGVATRGWSAGDRLPAAWALAIADATLAESLRRGRVQDTARRKLGCEADELTATHAQWVRKVATDERLAELAGGLLPALRQSLLASTAVSLAAARLRPSVYVIAPEPVHALRVPVPLGEQLVAA